jgi:hypothetical protein
MPPVGFEPPTSAGKRPQIYALDRSATGTDSIMLNQQKSRDFKHDISFTRFVASYFKTCFQILKTCLRLYLRSFVLVS